MNLDETILYSSLYNIYGELLTQKQQQIFDSYVFNNLSLAEIAENFNISRQAVLDCVNKACNQLKKYEETLFVNQNYVKIKCVLQEIKLNINNEKLLKKIDILLETL